MSIAKILAPVTGSKHDETTLRTAFRAGGPFASYVEVLFVHRDPRAVIQYSELTLRPEFVQNMVDTEIELQKIASQSARQTFAQVVKECGVTVQEIPSKQTTTTASYREMTGYLSTILANAATLSDLVVIPPVEKGDNDEAHDALIRVLTKVGRPVLLCPNQAPAQIGKKIAIGWDGRDAAAKALVAAIPFLEKADSVELISVGNLRAEDSTVTEAREFLALDDIRCAERVIQNGPRSIAAMLIDAARNGGCDLLVVGGYGHSRLVESIFGGVTDTIVSQPQLPILMVH